MAEDTKPEVGLPRQNRRFGKKLDPDLRRETVQDPVQTKTVKEMLIEYVPEIRVAPGEEVPPGQAEGQRGVVEGCAHHDDPPRDAAGHEEPGHDEVLDDNHVDMETLDDGRLVEDPESEVDSTRPRKTAIIPKYSHDAYDLCSVGTTPSQESEAGGALGEQEHDVQVPTFGGGGGITKSRRTFKLVVKRN